MDNTSKLDTLPREIMAEILSRLPVESLIRLKSLNKSWYFFIRCLIKDPEFVSKHLRCSETSPLMLLASRHRHGHFNPPGMTTGQTTEFVISMHSIKFFPGEDEDEDVEDESYDTVPWVIKDLNFPRCLMHLFCRYLLVYCCNGILCLSNDCSTFALYNPALCEFDTFNPSSGLDLDKNKVAGMGFGCDSTGSIYKVVRFFHAMKAEVFVPGGASDSWREIDLTIQASIFQAVSQVHAKGNLFWLIYDRPFAVICFDLDNEIFHDIPLPDEVCDYYRIWGFSHYNDTICVLIHFEDDIEVWVLDISRCDGGIRGCSYSWNKLLTVESLDRRIDLRTFWNAENGEILVNNEQGYIESYNLYDGEVKSLSIELVNEGICYFDRYVESLVSVKNINKA